MEPTSCFDMFCRLSYEERSKKAYLKFVSLKYFADMLKLGKNVVKRLLQVYQ